MASLETKYLGLSLKSPVIVGSSPLTQNVVSLEKCEEAGAGAVVLKSIFEEQIESEVSAEVEANDEYLNFSSAHNVYKRAATDFHIDKYIKLLASAKKELSIPVIASVCCKSLSSWSEYAERFVENGADAIELNYYPITSDARVDGRKVDDEFFSFIEFARKHISCPLTIKMGSKYSALANKIKAIDKAGIEGVVLFNRTFRPDVDIEKMEIVSGCPTTDGNDYTDSLRWTALMSGEVKMDICANTGIHSSETAIKMLLAGAKAFEVASLPIKEGFCSITRLNNEMKAWMERHNFNSISDFCGRLAQEESSDGYKWERTQFLKIISRD